MPFSESGKALIKNYACLKVIVHGSWVISIIFYEKLDERQA